MNSNHIAWWRLTKTIFALVLYYAAIVSLVVMTGFIIWKLIISNPSITEPWSVAGLAATILGVAATVLAILGAVAVAAWWGYLENRVTDQVNKLYDVQENNISARFNALLDEQQQKFNNLILKNLVTESELKHLRNLNASEFFAVDSGSFLEELRHLQILGFTEGVDQAHGITSLAGAFPVYGRVNVKDHLRITEPGKAYLEIRTKL